MAAPQAMTIKASHFRRRSTIKSGFRDRRPEVRRGMAAESASLPRPQVPGPRPLVSSPSPRCRPAALPDGTPGRPRGHQVLPLGQLLQPLRTQQLRFLQVQLAALVQQAPLFGAQLLPACSRPWWWRRGRWRRRSAAAPPGTPRRSATSRRRPLSDPARAPGASCRFSCSRRIRRPAAARAGRKGPAVRAALLLPAGMEYSRCSPKLRHYLVSVPRSPLRFRLGMRPLGLRCVFPLPISMARSLALRDGGFSAVSSSLGCSGCLVSTTRAPFPAQFPKSFLHFAVVRST